MPITYRSRCTDGNGYVVTTFFAMGFGYAVTATSLGRPIRGVWQRGSLCYLPDRHCDGCAAVLAGEASVLYTFIRRCWQALGIIAARSCSSAAR